AGLQLDRQNIGRGDKEVGAEVVALGMPGDLSEVCLQFLFACAPGEVGVGLGETELGKRLHHLWAGEGFRQENDLGILRANFVQKPFPKWKWLGVRVVDPKYADALVSPEQHDLAQRLPQRNAIVDVEIRIDNVFVFFRRVFSEAYRSIRAE